MKTGICCANLNNFTLPKDIPFIGVDRGTEKLLEQRITPSFAIGDFDSITHPEILDTITEIQTLPVRKDDTDTQAAVEWAIEKGFDEIDIYGATGGRLDHFIAVLILLELHKDIKIRIIDEQNEILLLTPGTHKITSGGYKYFSLFALDKAAVTITGAEYNVTDLLILRKNPLGCSNQVKEEAAFVKTTGDLWLIKSKDITGAQAFAFAK